MSNYPKGDWEKIWDGLFWRFIDKHQDFFLSNPRTSMLLNTFKRMPEDKQRDHIKNAEMFIQNKLHVV
jgi:deoxyribodipyrimidine photolyase-related protein